MTHPNDDNPKPPGGIPHLITGGCGFIGSAIAKRLFEEGHIVRIVDTTPPPSSSARFYTEYIHGDLRDPLFCNHVVKGVHTILHFAANMGGMGTIHSDNDFTLYRDNHSMTINLLEASSNAGVTKFLYASTACVYPNHLQNRLDDEDVHLRETDVWSADHHPSPQGLYGLEKLQGEMLLRQYSSKISVRIARLHNVYGPGGSWRGGREKAPAAFARKAIAAKRLKDFSMEIWGDGSQRRSFLYVDDCVDALIRLLSSNYDEAVNIGSDSSVTIRSLAETALDATGIAPSLITSHYDQTKPVGVLSRNSQNDRVEAVLGWKPTTSLEEGMKRMVAWVDTEIETCLSGLDEADRVPFLRKLQKSEVVQLNPSITFAVLLPITSRGTDSPYTCLRHLKNFAASLASTTWRDVRYGDVKFRIKVYLAIDHDDDFLIEGSRAKLVFQEQGAWDITQLICELPKGHVCSLWRECAAAAWNDGCDYMALFGDDVELLDEGWLQGIHKTFQELPGPEGFGCVAFTDISFPGMPTFPVIHRTHMDIFEGLVVPPQFINQDGDPFLFQLYRRFGSSVMTPFRLRNAIGGSDDARYEKQHLKEWTFGVLDDATKRVEEWAITMGHNLKMDKKLTIDIVIPSFRVQLDTLSRILDLESSDTCEVMFIIIVDNPRAAEVDKLERQCGHRPDVRIRVNSINLGASASRNRGMDEASGEWIFFLDDDVLPDPTILFEAEKAIRADPSAAGFVGTTIFPPADTVFKTAVHLAGVTYFWDIARKLSDDLPWGVTANLIARRNNDGVRYDPRFPKTGGGEDIDFCIRKRDLFVKDGKRGFKAAPHVVATHPWWNNGRRSYWRFYMWAKGDGGLVSMFPKLCYSSVFPTSGQLFLYTGALTLVGVITMKPLIFRVGLAGVLSTISANVSHDLFRHVLREEPDPRSTISALFWSIAVVESTIIRMMSELGRIVSQMERGEWSLVFGSKRFDWFAGRVGDGPRDNEVKNSRERWWLTMFLIPLFFRVFAKLSLV